jgi:hypothetical protein
VKQRKLRLLSFLAVVTPLPLPEFWPNRLAAWFIHADRKFQLKVTTYEFENYEHKPDKETL